jgi:glutathione S-transferase
MQYRLHYFPESGNSYKLALMLTLCGQSFEPVWTDFGGGITRTDEWRARVNAMGEIPVLEDGGVCFTQTAPILLRLSSRHKKFAGDSDDDRFEILRWLFWDNHKLTGYMATYRFQRAFTSSPDQAVLRFLRRRIDDFLAILETHLSSRTFVGGCLGQRASKKFIGHSSPPRPRSRPEAWIRRPRSPRFHRPPGRWHGRGKCRGRSAPPG